MSLVLRCLCGTICLSLGIGCAAQSRYEWGEYDTKLYAYYANPAEQQKFTESMKEVVMAAEAEGRVPPGIYAEYGYLLLAQGDGAGAVHYFKKEAGLWPESRPLMNKMVLLVDRRSKKSSKSVQSGTGSTAIQAPAGGVASSPSTAVTGRVDETPDRPANTNPQEDAQ